MGDVHALACVSCGSYGLQLLGYIKHTMLDAWASLPEVGAGNHWQEAWLFVLPKREDGTIPSEFSQKRECSSPGSEPPSAG